MAYTKLTANRAAPVTPSDTALIPNISNPEGTNNGCVLYIGSEGSVKVKTAGGDILTFEGAYSGQFFPVNVIQVFSTGTTASDIIALW
jgi:hypothetical protein